MKIKVEIDTENMELTMEMKMNFVNYLRRHQKAVLSNARMLYRRGKIPRSLLIDIACEHDESKLKEPEFTPYVRRKWLERNTNADLYQDMGDDVKAAIVHHITTNKHHPEYWSSDYAGFESKEPCHVVNMPEECVVEMICDWVAMGEEKGNTARAWYDKTKNTRWIFDAETTERIEYWLTFFDDMEILY